jgi:hypothetical protein
MSSSLAQGMDAERWSANAGMSTRAAATGLRVLLGIIWFINGAFQAYAWLLPGEQSRAELLQACSGPLASISTDGRSPNATASFARKIAATLKVSVKAAGY